MLAGAVFPMKINLFAHRVVFACLGAATSLILAGCGGSGSNLLSVSPTPTSVVAASSESIGPQQFRLKTGQLVSFFLQTYAGETRVTGSGEIFGFGPVGSRPPGRIDIINATRLGPRDFAGTLTSSNDLFMVRLATATEPGTFTIGPPNKRESGVIVPTSEAQPTPTPTSFPGPAQFNLTVVASSDSNYRDVPFGGAVIFRTSINTVGANAGGNLDSTGTSTGLEFADLPLRVGATLDAAKARQNTLSNSEYRGESRLFRARSGQLELTALNGNQAIITFRNVVYAPFDAQNKARGTVTVNGTITGPF